MKIFAAIALTLSVAPAYAQTTAPTATAAADVKAGAAVSMSDGKRVGKIDHVLVVDGRPVSVSIIFNGHFVAIPVSTLSTGDHGLVTTLGRADLAKL